MFGSHPDIAHMVPCLTCRSWATLYGSIPKAIDIPTYCKKLNTTTKGDVTAKGITNVWYGWT